MEHYVSLTSWVDQRTTYQVSSLMCQRVRPLSPTVAWGSGMNICNSRHLDTISQDVDMTVPHKVEPLVNMAPTFYKHTCSNDIQSESRS